MIKISYAFVIGLISVIWCLVRIGVAIKNRGVSLKRELQLLLVYACIIVVARFTLFPFSKVDGEIQPLIFEIEKALSFRINLLPFVYLFDYPTVRESLINVIGNTTMFIPIGVVYPIVYQNLNTHKKVILAGVGFSLCIEILQLPFYDRVSDVDDLILNSVGFILGYLLYLGVKKCRNRNRA